MIGRLLKLFGHPVAVIELSAYVDGQLASSRRPAVEEHLNACTACRRRVAELRALKALLADLPDDPAPRSFAIREAQSRPVHSAAGISSRLIVVPAAAFAVLAMLVAVDLVAVGGGDGSAGESRSTGLFSKATNDSGALAAPTAVSAARSAPPAAAASSTSQREAAPAAANAGAAPAEPSVPPPVAPTIAAPPATGREAAPASPTGDEDGTGEKWLRILEVAAATVGIGSFAYLVYRRRAAG